MPVPIALAVSAAWESRLAPVFVGAIRIVEIDVIPNAFGHVSGQPFDRLPVLDMFVIEVAEAVAAPMLPAFVADVGAARLAEKPSALARGSRDFLDQLAAVVAPPQTR